ncbi:metal ABC transporter permease [Caldicellulosiruptoraceae bacterium PP1]
MLSYAFMQRALLAGFFISIIAPFIGSFTTLKRFSQIGDSLSHTAIVGVAASLLLSINPIIGSIIATIIFSLLLYYIKGKFIRYAEISLSLVSVIALALASVLFGIMKSSANVMSFLFGSIVLVNWIDVAVIVTISIISFVILFGLKNKLLYTTFDEIGAKVSGINTEFFEIVLNILTALIIAVSVRIIGGLLISALLVFPVAISMQIASNFKRLLIFSTITSIVSVLSGIILSYYFDIPPGGSIILVFIAISIIIEIYKKLIRKE